MTECIDIISNSRTNSKTLQKVALPMEELALPSDGCWQVGIGLNHLTTSDMPLTPIDQTTNPRKKLRIQAFDQAIEPRLSPCIEKLWVLITAVSSGTKGSQRFIGALLPAPEPDGIEMGITNHVYSQHYVSPQNKASFIIGTRPGSHERQAEETARLPSAQ